MAISRWSQLVTLISQEVQDPSLVFLNEQYVRQYLKEGQQDICRRVKALRREYSTVTVASQQAYTLPIDFLEVDLKPQVADWPIDYIHASRIILKTTPTGQPFHWTMKGERTISFYSTPSAASDTILVPYFRKTPLYGLHLTRNTSGSCSAANVEITASAGTMTASTMVLTQTGATPGSYSIDLTAAAYDTLAELVTYINTLSGWTAILDATCAGTDASTLLEVRAAQNCYNTTTAVVDEDMEIGTDFNPTLIHYTLFRYFDLDEQGDKAQKHFALYEKKVEEEKETYWPERRKTSFVKRIRPRIPGRVIIP